MNREQRQRAHRQVSIDWILDYILDRTWLNAGAPPKIKAKGPGWRVGVFRSGTGTGKSTVFPPYLYTKFYEKLGIKKNIICTQPTIVTATDIPYQVALYNPNMILGETIGYQTGSYVRKPVRGVLFATIGILLQHLKQYKDDDDAFMKLYSFIIIDEIHNRSIETDSVLFHLRNFLERNYDNPECPYVILTSGTFEPEEYMEYFGCPPESFLDIRGASFPITEHFTKFPVSNYLAYIVDLVEKLHIDNVADIAGDGDKLRDIMVFVQGSAPIKKIVNAVHKLNAEVFSKGLAAAQDHLKGVEIKYPGVLGGKGDEDPTTGLYICPITLMSENIQKGARDYQNLFSDIRTVVTPIYSFVGDEPDEVIKYVPASRRLVVATNSAETGLTIDTLKYCIDSGFVQESQFNPNFGTSALMNKNITRANSTQRRGRVGRKGPGHFYACYSKETFDAMPAMPFPDIIKADISTLILDTIISETGTDLIQVDREKVTKSSFQLNQLDQWWYEIKHKKPFVASDLYLIQYPAADSMSYSMEKLHGLGFIDHEYKPTLFGIKGSQFRKVSLENIRMILAGFHHGANILDLITITCFLQAGHKLGIKKDRYKPRNPFGLPMADMEKYFAYAIADEFIEYIFIWNDFMTEVERLGKVVEQAVSRGDDRGLSGNGDGGRMGPGGDGSDGETKKTGSGRVSAALSDWAKENGFNIDVLMRIVSARDEVIGDLLNIGINPFYNGLGMPRGKYNLTKILKDNFMDGLEEVKKIKHCIYEGYRFNLYIWNAGLRAYVSNYGHNKVTLDKSKLIRPLVPTEGIQQIRPQKIILSHVMIQTSGTDRGMYEFKGADISVMDGYVDVDVEFLNH